MRKLVPVVFGVLICALGVLWTLQGLGYLEGSVMTGSSTWAIIGPAVAGLGVALVIVGFGGGRGGRR